MSVQYPGAGGEKPAAENSSSTINDGIDASSCDGLNGPICFEGLDAQQPNPSTMRQFLQRIGGYFMLSGQGIDVRFADVSYWSPSHTLEQPSETALAKNVTGPCNLQRRDNNDLGDFVTSVQQRFREDDTRKTSAVTGRQNKTSHAAKVQLLFESSTR